MSKAASQHGDSVQKSALLSQVSDFEAWRGDVVYQVEVIGEMDNGDADGFTMTKEFDLMQMYGKGVPAEAAARQLLGLSATLEQAPPANDYVRIECNCDEEGQRSSFQNGTLQGFGQQLAVTIQTHVAIPAELENCNQQEAVAFLNSLLTAASASVGNKLVFDVQIGVSVDASVR